MITNNTILITGATGGLGRALVKAYTNQGDHVIALGRNFDDFNYGPRASSYKIDFRSNEALEGKLKAIADKHQIDAIIHAIGTSDGVGPIDEIKTDEWMANFQVNFMSCVHVNNIFIQQMKAKRSGSIIHVTSMAATTALNWLAPYCSSKAALQHYSLCLAKELKPFGIRSNAIGVCAETKLYNAHREQKFSKGYYGDKKPTKRDMPKAEENIAPFLLLTSDAGKHISGQYLEAHIGNL